MSDPTAHAVRPDAPPAPPTGTDNTLPAGRLVRVQFELALPCNATPHQLEEWLRFNLGAATVECSNPLLDHELNPWRDEIEIVDTGDEGRVNVALTPIPGQVERVYHRSRQLTEAEHPALLSCLQAMLRRNGRAGQDNPDQALRLFAPTSVRPLLATAEQACRRLTEEERLLFADGDDEEIKSLIARDHDMQAAQTVMLDCFENYDARRGLWHSATPPTITPTAPAAEER